jgi:hypothetical protein
MKYYHAFSWFLIILAVISCGRSPSTHPPLSLNPDNPHYFLFRGKPEILIGSTEHYGAVMNLDFDYVAYLDELDSTELNVTRTFSGAYVEPQGAFGIIKNTLAPAPGKYICPWARSDEPGYANGGNKFDLSKWDAYYFSRLKDFITEAGRRNIVVELDLFSNYYDTLKWHLCPFYINNNINNIGNIKDHKEVLSLQHPEMVAVQEKMVRKIVNELKDFDNLYYEICNEPYFGDTLALRSWEKYMTGVVVDAEKEFPYKHLISNNVANNYLKIEDPRPGVSIYNFHYARPPVTVDMNYHLNKVIGDNETGFDGIENTSYREEAWDFLLAGGGLFDNLDYSFTADNESGNFIVKEGEPGGGGRSLRNQFKILAEFMHSIDFIDMTPVNNQRFKSVDGETSIRALSQKDELFAVYFHRKDTANKNMAFEIELPEGSYSLIWTDTRTAGETNTEIKYHRGGFVTITSPSFSEDIAMRIARKE